MKEKKEKFTLFNFRYFTYLLLFCASGVALATLLYQYVLADYIVLILSGIAILFVSLFLGKKGIKLCTFILAFAIFYLSSIGVLSYRVKGIEEIKKDFLEVKIEFISSDKSVVHCSFDMGEARLLLVDDIALREGEVLLLSDVRINSSSVLNEDGSFNTYALTQNKRFEIEFSEIYEIRGFYPTISQTIRSSVKEATKDLPSSTGGVITALLTGDKYGIDPSVYTDYKHSGIAHVLAVSGLHVVFMCSAVDFLLKKFKVKKKTRAFLSIPVLFIFSACCSFAPSVIRASLMTSLAKIIPAISRKRYDTLSVMSLSAIILLATNPLNLINYGFALSYASVFGIVAFGNRIKAKLDFLPRFLSESLSTSTAVSITTFPLCVLFFGEVSILSFLSNIIVLPILALFYGIIFGVAIIGAIFPFLSVIIAPLCVVIAFINTIASVIGGLSFGIVRAVAPVWILIAYYICVVLLSNYAMMKKEYKIATFCMLIAVILIWLVI